MLDTHNVHTPHHTFKAMLHPGLMERVLLAPEPTPAPVKPVPKPAEHLATCDSCDRTIIGVRWKCLDCPDWDACHACAAVLPQIHPGHDFVKLRNATDLVESRQSINKVLAFHKDIMCDGEYLGLPSRSCTDLQAVTSTSMALDTSACTPRARTTTFAKPANASPALSTQRTTPCLR